jgi:DNA-binding response OmpR family regulator
MLARCRPDVVIVDLEAPSGAGLDLCRWIRERHGALIIALATRSDGEDRIAALEHGADDCLTKPFAAGELLARLDALLRRAPQQESVRRLQVGDLLLDSDQRAVSVGSRKVDLRQREFDLLLELARNAGRVLTREELLGRVWRDSRSRGGETLDVHVHRLRAKLSAGSVSGKFIETVRGVGYRLHDDVACP